MLWLRLFTEHLNALFLILSEFKQISYFILPLKSFLPLNHFSFLMILGRVEVISLLKLTYYRSKAWRRSYIFKLYFRLLLFEFQALNLCKISSKKA